MRNQKMVRKQQRDENENGEEDPAMRNQKMVRKQQRDENGEEDPAGQEKTPLFSLFPEEMVETIIARISFPYVLKTLLLSNSWNRNFSSALADSSRKALTQFQKEVSSVSHKWPRYSPVFVNKECFRGFDPVSSQWKSMFPHCKLNFISRDVLMDVPFYSCLGPLVLVAAMYTIQSGEEEIMLVINLITGCSKKLYLKQGRKFGCNRSLQIARLLPGDSNSSYRVPQVRRVGNLGNTELQTNVYDSKTGGWSGVTISRDLRDLPSIYKSVDFRSFCDNDVYLHGKLYCLCKVGDLRTAMLLCTHHVDGDKTWTYDRLSFSHDVVIGGVVFCGGIFMVVTYTSDFHVVIYELDRKVLGSWKRLVTKHRIQPQTHRLVNTHYIRLASDDDFIYVGEYFSRYPVHAYNVQSGEWGTLPPAWSNKCSVRDERKTVMLHSALTPGLDPFAIV